MLISSGNRLKRGEGKWQSTPYGAFGIQYLVSIMNLINYYAGHVGEAKHIADIVISYPDGIGEYGFSGIFRMIIR